MTSKAPVSPRDPVSIVSTPVDHVARINEVVKLLVAGLRDAYGLNELEQSLAQAVLFGSTSRAIAGQLGVDEGAALGAIQKLLARTNTDGRGGLMRLALRLAGERERADVPIASASGLAPSRSSCGRDPKVTRVTATRSRYAGAWPVAPARIS
ncbi:hypothetical protein ENSA5_46730 [Enhygromyxa salina]|uniref:Uncharacterized protein n=1 Tax=Enhygromyxa salina TaxID=215803 RepID=A0A2S9XJH6_9BACT|nr:hypothetical protein [Enhygromyxa salina]PRP92841.1 hypothetical protein ENSA5_46730 [Enhygromyxa salina]